MFIDAHPMLRLATSLVLIGATALIGQRLGLPMSVADVPKSSSRFWWTMAAFAAPVGVANQVLFQDGLILRVLIIIVVAGLGVWVGERFSCWRGRS